MMDSGRGRSIKRAVLLFIFIFTSVVLIGIGVLALARHMSGRSRILSSEEDRLQSEVQTKTEKRAEEGVAWDALNGLPGAEAVEKADKNPDDVRKTSSGDAAAEIGDKTADGGEPEDAGDIGDVEEEEPPEPYADVPEDRYTRRAATAEPKTVRIGFAGDILFDRSYAIQAQMESRGGGIEGAVGASLLKEMRDVDIMVANNEFPYTDGGAPQEGKTFTFHAAVKNVRQMSEMGVDLAGIANNHVFDYGETGFLDTLDTLDRAGIARMGAGRDIEEASHPLYYIAGGMKIAFIAATQIERHDNPNTRGATDTLPGVFRCMDETRLLKVVSEAKKESDYVIVFIHWGTENELGPDWLQSRQAPELAEAGADLVVGMHSHCLQPVTYEGNVPVFYSLGNFLFNSKTLDTCLVEATLVREEAEGSETTGAAEKGGPAASAGSGSPAAGGTVRLESLRFIPCIQSGCTVRMADDAESERILSFMRNVSPGVSFDGDGYISKQ